MLYTQGMSHPDLFPQPVPPPATSAPPDRATHLDRLNEAQRRGRRGGRRAGAGAGRRRHRQDPGADDAARPYPGDRAAPSRRDPRRHLHQQGGARDARAARGDDRRAPPRASGSAPSTRSPRASCAATPSGRAQVELHDPRHRRPDPPAEADPRRPPNIDERRWPARVLLGAHRALEGPRPHPRQGAGRPRPAISPTAARSSSTAPIRSGSRRVNAVDFGDLLLHNLTLFTEQPGDPRRLSAALPLSAGRRVPGHQRRAVSLAAAPGAAAPQPLLRRRRRPVDL